MKKDVIDEAHYMKANQIANLEHNNIVKGSFCSNRPLFVNHKDGTIRTGEPSLYPDGKFEVLVSYVYETDGE